MITGLSRRRALAYYLIPKDYQFTNGVILATDYCPYRLKVKRLYNLVARRPKSRTRAQEESNL